MSGSPSASGRLHLRGLDGLRCLSVVFVVLTHFGAFGPYVHAFERSGLGSRLVSLVHGIAGVSTFFVISGYLITTLLLREQGQNGRIDLKAFYARRFHRIVPCYAVFLAVLFVLTVLVSIYVWQGLFLRTGPADGPWYQQAPQNLALTVLHALGRRLIRANSRNIPDEQIAQLPDALVEAETYNTLGSIISYRLHQAGWKMSAPVGEPVAFTREGVRIEPFMKLKELEAGTLDAEGWQRYCAEAGIAELGA